MGLIYKFDILVSRPQNDLCICIWISVMIICSFNLICLSTQLTVRHGTVMYYLYMCRYMDGYGYGWIYVPIYGPGEREYIAQLAQLYQPSQDCDAVGSCSSDK